VALAASTFLRAKIGNTEHCSIVYLLSISNSRRKSLWGSEISVNPPSVDYNDVMHLEAEHEAVGQWTKNLVISSSFFADKNDIGFSFIDNVPTTPEATQSLIEKLAYIMPSHYGGFWDFTSDLQHSDTAYTSLALPAHTDTTYYTQSAGLQLFVNSAVTLTIALSQTI
jgi:trimethyllysine dioxygenase